MALEDVRTPEYSGSGMSGFRNAGDADCRHSGMSELTNVLVPECQGPRKRFEMSEFRNIRVEERWSLGMSGFRKVGAP